MTFLVLVIGLLVLRFGGDIGSLQRDQWFSGWCRRLAGVTWLQRRPGLDSVLAVLLPAAALALLLWLMREWWFGLPVFGLSLVVLLYSFGRGDIEGELRLYREAVARGDTQAAYHDAAPFNPSHREGEAMDWPGLQAEFETGLSYRWFEREFAVIFWFAVLGPAGALLYRLARLRVEGLPGSGPAGESGAPEPFAASPEAAAVAAERVLHWLEWLPARLLVPSLAVVGNFTPVMQRFSELCCNAVTAAPLLSEAVRAALVLRQEDLERPDGLELVNAVEDLLRRALVLWVAVAALVVLFL